MVLSVLRVLIKSFERNACGNPLRCPSAPSARHKQMRTDDDDCLFCCIIIFLAWMKDTPSLTRTLHNSNFYIRTHFGVHTVYILRTTSMLYAVLGVFHTTYAYLSCALRTSLTENGVWKDSFHQFANVWRFCTRFLLSSLSECPQDKGV